MTDSEVAAYAAESELESKVGRRQMRQAGLTVLNVRRTTRSLAREGYLKRGMTNAQIQDTVLDAIFAQNPTEVGAVNWDAIIAFIEKLLPLILQILAIFGL